MDNEEAEGCFPTPDTAEHKNVADATSTTDATVRRNGILNGVILKAIDEDKCDAFRRKLRRAKFNGSGVHCMIELMRMHPMTAKSAVNAAISNVKPKNVAIVKPPQGEETTADAIKTWAVEIEQDWIDCDDRVHEHPGEKLAVNDVIRAATDKLLDTCPELKTDHEFTAGIRNVLDGKDPKDEETNEQVDLDPNQDDDFWQWLVKDAVSKACARRGHRNDNQTQQHHGRQLEKSRHGSIKRGRQSQAGSPGRRMSTAHEMQALPERRTCPASLRSKDQRRTKDPAATSTWPPTPRNPTTTMESTMQNPGWGARAWRTGPWRAGTWRPGTRSPGTKPRRLPGSAMSILLQGQRNVRVR